ncbi:biotin--[acetyl-CoA-carboxylase] ligase [Fructilactobacillus carniphilus]|uniref:Biotin--[acetyl-CoA-carboxylase] ligase n=1 Tax=Fructilactobacillus carniphilus TaxID=2940297 RepID=A0ABY5BYR0_9LACO|nr:biotin--[acetyl-CoA-carboxylase] ligase [Fructilactobacillus carniphilus]USS90241.1 biotin--[acetyl-CoA-carboxylase] ligase [Fructilactobacillus carniphilus]
MINLEQSYLLAQTGLDMQHLHLFAEVDSTMTVAERLRLPGIHLIAADRMTAGRGQRGHSFTAPATGVYVTIVIPVRPVFLQQPGLLTMGVAAATHQVLETVLRVTTSLKWINDLYLHNHKVGGILVELKSDAQNQPESFMIGIGLNLAPHHSLATVNATALSTTMAAKNQLIAALYKQVVNFSVHPNLQRVRDCYNQHLLWRGQLVQVQLGNQLKRGLLQGLDQQLRLELVDQNGQLHHLTPEEATHLRPVQQ